MLLDALLVRLNAASAVVVERDTALGQKLHRLEHIVQDDRLEHVQLKVAVRAGHADGYVVAEHLHGDHRQSFGLGGIDLTRHDRRAGLVFRDPQFADACPRSTDIEADVVGDLHAGADLTLTIASSADKAANLLGAEVKGSPVSLARIRATVSPKRGSALRPVPTAVPPIASGIRPWQACSTPAIAWSSCAAQPEITCPRVRGVASCRCVRPTITIWEKVFDFALSVSRN